MEDTVERIVEVLRRCGPGVLPTDRLRRELLRLHPTVVLSTEQIRNLARDSGKRLLFVQVGIEAVRVSHRARSLASWVALTSPADAPLQPGFARPLWEGLAALGAEVTPYSRLEACRWAIKAEEAMRACLATGPWSR